MAAAIRETREEAGINVDERDLSLEYAFSLYDAERDTVIARLLFVARVEMDDVKLSHEHTEFWWSDIDEVEDLFSATSLRGALGFIREHRLAELT